MKTSTAMIRTVFVLLALASSAAAQTALPALKANVTVASDIVRIGDLIENAGAAADVPIFRAPDLGTTGAVATARVIEAIRPHALVDIDTRGLAQVVVTRASRGITREEITNRLAQVLAGQYGLGEPRDIAIRFDQEPRTLHVEPTETGELQPRRVSYDQRTARFDVSFDVPGSASRRAQAWRFTGTAVTTAEAIVVDRPIEHGEVLKASDVSVARRSKSEIGDAAIRDIDAAIGLAARHPLRPGQVLRSSDLMKPEIVQRNETVTIIYKAPGIILTARGKAQESGALGDSIGVLNESSKRVVQGTISAPGQITVGGASPSRLVANAPDAASAAAAQPQAGTE